MVRRGSSTIDGHQRQVRGTLTVEKIYKDREAFAATVKEGVLEDMANMGYELVSYVVTDVSDDNGYMDALGMTQTAKVKRDAAEGVAFDNLRQFLEQIEGVSGLAVLDASVSSAGRSGGVNATFRVAGT